MLRKLKKVFKARRQGSTTKSPDIDVVNTPFLELMEKLRGVEVTLTETMKEQLRDRIVSMSTEERREYYDCGGAFLVSEQIPSWQDTGQTGNKGASNVLFEPDDLLNSKVALWQGDIFQLELDVWAVANLTGVSGTAGPMARDLDGLVQMMRAILCDYHFELDPYIPPIPFRDEIFESKRQLRVGFYVNDGYIPVVPACGRAVMMAKRALEQQGHTVCL